ncbi:PadR family transcriptional regulator [Halorubrum cibi]|uniref:Transcriptional regulator PadR-like family protein n=1 Tax=Halorubrum cibi TaxID=413815 RepID=A0A521F3L1_9EURY|nr:helix-turn-helix transcriptional regulator [Halorubrum cibi]SMO90775.1 Transcriptional regulator PadR-like family protein [Halorubrum cibi]
MSSAAQVATLDDYVDLTGFQRDVLWQLYHLDGADYGLAIKESLESMGYDQVHHGRLYPNLGTLADKGLIEKSALDKRTNMYSLTDEAAELLADRQSWERGEE